MTNSLVIENSFSEASFFASLNPCGESDQLIVHLNVAKNG